ncbi:hypothetical protein HMPREF9413_3362 [Paenibacillus sp. HGF7]|nr:hypothetical protein HMPREF9413_3362 [Paenibacillus sp. HGF7]
MPLIPAKESGAFCAFVNTWKRTQKYRFGNETFSLTTLGQRVIITITLYRFYAFMQ